MHWRAPVKRAAFYWGLPGICIRRRRRISVSGGYNVGHCPGRLDLRWEIVPPLCNRFIGLSHPSGSLRPVIFGNKGETRVANQSQKYFISFGQMALQSQLAYCALPYSYRPFLSLFLKPSSSFVCLHFSTFERPNFEIEVARAPPRRSHAPPATGTTAGYGFSFLRPVDLSAAHFYKAFPCQMCFCHRFHSCGIGSPSKN